MGEIEFYSTFRGSRPKRLSEATRLFAFESLQGKYGRQTRETPSLAADGIPGFADLTPYRKYDEMIALIAREAPMRICEGELLSGSASLGDAIYHKVPVNFEGKTVFGSVSHLTCNFDRVVREGLDSYRGRIARRMEAETSPDEAEFLRSLVNVYDSCKVYHGRVLAELEKRGMTEQYENLKNVPFAPPENFRQALQSLWFTFAFLRLCGNWPGLGRLDLILGLYLERDLAEGALTEDEAREYIAHFFIKGCEWIRLDSRGTGDAQHYQNIVLAGIDEDGNEIANTATRLILEVVEEFPISDFPIAVRVNDKTPGWLLRKTAEVMRHGSGVAAIYNETQIIRSLVEFGYSEAEARRFANDGCWEIQVPGKTCFGYNPIDIYGMFEREVLGLFGDETVSYPDFESMYGAFREMLRSFMERWHRDQDSFASRPGPMTAVAFFTDDCIERARDYHNGGARYNVISPHLGGVPDLADCMYAVNKLVWEEKKLTFPELMSVLKNNWEGSEELRQYVRRSYVFYGNDSDGADSIVVRIMDDFMRETRKVRSRNDVLRPPGVSTFGRQIDWKDKRAASAHGFRTGDILASNLSPTPGTDKKGATAVIRSHCKVDLERLTCGTALDLKLDPSSVKGEEGVEAVIGLMLGFVKLGGIFLQIDVLDNEVLLDAQKHPENYQNLSVRISGWSARFVTLSDDWQRMIIERSTQK